MEVLGKEFPDFKMEVKKMWGFFKKRYMGWDEYLSKIEDIEKLLFVSETAEQSIRNYWSKRREKWLI